MKLNPKAGGVRKGSGRGKQGYYKGIWCDSTWELAYVIFCIDKKIKIKRNKEGFEYVYNGSIHKYFPDFIINDDYFVEIKGYKNGQFYAKKKYFKHKLKIIDIKNIDKYLNYAVEKFGKDFHNQYKGDENDCKKKEGSK